MSPVPQFILDALILEGQGSTANILVTQPRRISAISVAARVSTERVDDGTVGYTIRGESKQSEKTKLLFCTTGVVLRRLGSGDGLKDVTHVIVDEVCIRFWSQTLQSSPAYGRSTSDRWMETFYY